MKVIIYNQLTYFRDNSWVRGTLLEIIDWLRYEWFYQE